MNNTNEKAAYVNLSDFFVWWDWVEPDCFLYPAQAAQPVQAQRWARSALLAELP